MDLRIQILIGCVGMTKLLKDDPTRAAYNNISGQGDTKWITVRLFRSCLDLETTGFSATASTLEL